MLVEMTTDVPEKPINPTKSAACKSQPPSEAISDVPLLPPDELDTHTPLDDDWYYEQRPPHNGG
jgi:hypothetical protein